MSMELSRRPETTSKRIALLVRGAGLALPLLFIIYAVMVQQNIIRGEAPLLSNSNAFTLCALWVVIGVLQIVKPSTTKASSLLRLIANHIIAGSFLLLVIGFASPLVYTWSILIVAMYIYFGLGGMTASIVILLSLAIFDSAAHSFDTTIVVENIFATLTTSLIGGLAVGSIQGRAVDQSEVDSSHAQVSYQQERMVTLVNNLADAVLTTDSDGKVKVYNAAALNLLDTNTELDGQLVDDILRLHTTDKHSFSLISSLTDSETTITRDDLIAVISGEPVRLEITASPVRGNFSDAQVGDTGYIIILRDVTTSKSLEEERDEFISVVSHELRTPITIAEGTISNVQLMMQRDDTNPDTLEKAVDLAHDQVVFLSRMVNDLSTLSRAERGVADEPELINLEQMIRDLYSEYSPQAEAKGLEFNLHSPERPGSVMASQLYLKELLQNFITNAIKYTKEGSVTLEAHRHKSKPAVTLSVRDSGIGMSKTDLRRIFDKFYRSEDYRTRETGGTGLGLYVSEKLAKKLNTEIEVKSRLNYGSTFSFTLPVADVADVTKK